jgi:hypothetical protein
LTEHRAGVEARVVEQVARATAASLATRKRAAMVMSLAGLITACVLGVAGSAWIGGAIALASLASWFLGQRGVNEREAILAALPAARPPPALPEPSEDAEEGSRGADP